MNLEMTVRTLADIPTIQAAQRGNEAAISLGGRNITYNEIDEMAHCVAHNLAECGIEAGDRVAFLGETNERMFPIFFGASRARAIFVSVNARLAEAEIVHILKDCGAKLLFVTASFKTSADALAKECPALQTIITVDGNAPASLGSWISKSYHKPDLSLRDEDVAALLYTSGTTGLPKGVQLTHANFCALLQQGRDAGLFTYAPGERVYDPLPLFHIAGIGASLMCLSQGGHLYLTNEFDPSAMLADLVNEQIDYLFLVPVILMMMIQVPGIEKAELSNLKRIYYGAAPIAKDLLLKVRSLLDCELVQLFGMTETTGGCAVLPPDVHTAESGKLRAFGLPLPGTEVWCVDESGNFVGTGEIGEIVVRSPLVMKGYWGNEEATAETIQDGILYTGDIGYMDADGYFYIHDRKKNMIISGAENIYPAEVENVLFAHPDIGDLVVIGVPSERWGEEVKAIVIPAPGSNPSEEDIISWARERLSHFKCPKSVSFVETLPRTASGKVLRREVQDPYWADHERQVG